MQFRYFFEQNNPKHDVVEARTPSIVYQKDIAPLVSTATTGSFGSGARYEIDALLLTFTPSLG